MEKKKLSLALQIFIALVIAIIVGLLLGTKGAPFANSYIKPFGTIFLNLIKFIVCPIVLVVLAENEKLPFINHVLVTVCVLSSICNEGFFLSSL